MRKLTEQQFSRDNKGSVMALALLMVVLLSVGGIALLRLALDARLWAVRIAAAISARAAADAGLTKAIFEMNKSLIDESWSFNDIVSQVEAVLPHTNASYSYTIDEVAHNYEFRIASTGQSGQVYSKMKRPRLTRLRI
jgi:Tfp pilus assembly protein PilX